MASAEIRRVQFRACPEAMLRLMENHPRGTFLMRYGTRTGVPRLPPGESNWNYALHQDRREHELQLDRRLPRRPQLRQGGMEIYIE